MFDVSDGLSYDQDKPGVIERDLRMAHAAGLSGFMVNWAGTGSTSQTPSSTSYSRRLEEVFRAAKELRAEGKRFTIILDYKTASRQPVSHIANDLTYFLGRYGNNPGLDHSYSPKTEVVIRFRPRLQRVRSADAARPLRQPRLPDRRRVVHDMVGGAGRQCSMQTATTGPRRIRMETRSRSHT